MPALITRRVLFPLVLALLLGGLTWTFHAEAFAARAPGFAIPYADGSPGSWIGSYSTGGAQTYCIDPRRRGSTAAALDGHRRVLRSLTDLTGRDVPARDLQRAAWIASNAGVTTSRIRAAAVDTALHALLGRGRYAWGASRSEARMRATGHYREIRAEAARLLGRSAQFAGAARLRLSVSRQVYAGGPVTVTASVTTEYDVPVPGVVVRTDYPLDEAGPVTGVTDRHGRVSWTFTPTRVGSQAMTATAQDLATRFPVVLVPDDHRFQRLAIAGLTHDLTRTATATVTPSTVGIATVTSAPAIDPGDSLSDTVTVTAPDDFHAVITARLYGPFRNRPTSTSCTADLMVGTVEHDWTGSGTFVTDPVGPLTEPGYYTWVEEVPATGITRAARTSCGEETETSLVRRYRPHLATTTSVGRATVGALLTDTVTVTDFPADTATLTAYLAGPFSSRDAVRCRTNTSPHVQLTITGSGTYSTPAIRVTRPGWYSWFEVLPATPSSEGVRTPCRIASETSLVTRPIAPAVHIDSGPDSVRPAARTVTAYAGLAIRSIGIDVHAQTTTPSHGVLTPPAGPDRVGWYAATARFADRIGSLVIGGHVATPTGGRGPFGRLGRVSLGDRVVLTRNGARRVLEVVSKRSYPRSEPLPTSLFDLATGFRVVLVTCTHKVTRPDGSWHYTDNLVVIAR
jgi:hypothetical protein